MSSPACPVLSSAAIEALAGLADQLAIALEPWWLIGGAAVALHGFGIDHLADIDVIMGPSDARRLLRALNVSPEESGGSDRFRSKVFGHWLGLPIAVDLMGGFEVYSGGVWRPVEPRTREAVTVAGRTLFVPSREELIAILRVFARPKDLARADGLSRVRE